jgi:hypothetical protein
VIKSHKDLLAWQKAMVARAAQSEVETQVEIAKRLGHIQVEQARSSQIPGKIINGLMNSMERYAVAHGR